MFGWIRKHKVTVGVIVFGIVFGVPFAIHVAFKIPAFNSFFMAEWTAGDLLGYYGSILAFLGTVVLGILALYQSHIIKVEADKKAILLEKREHDSNMPIFVVNVTLSHGFCNDLHIEIRNISDNSANDVQVLNIRILGPDNQLFWKNDTIFEFATIRANDKVKMELKNPSIREARCTFLMDMTCKDKYCDSHEYIVKGVNKEVDKVPEFCVTEIS